MFRNQLSEKAVIGRLKRYRKMVEREPEKAKSEMIKAIRAIYTAGNRIPNIDGRSAKKKARKIKKCNPDSREDQDKIFNTFKKFCEEELKVDTSSVEER